MKECSPEEQAVRMNIYNVGNYVTNNFKKKMIGKEERQKVQEKRE